MEVYKTNIELGLEIITQLVKFRFQIELVLTICNQERLGL